MAICVVAALATALSLAERATQPVCNSLTGVWNAAPGTTGKLVNITNPSPGGALTASWWLPNPGTTVAGHVGGADNRRFTLANGLSAAVSTSPVMAKGTSGPAPACSYLTFEGAQARSQWCLQPWCPDKPAPSPPAPPGPPAPPAPPAPNDPATIMPNFVVANAVATGALYPDGGPANFFLNRTGGTGWVIHLSGGGWRFVGAEGEGEVAGDRATAGGVSHGMTADGVGGSGGSDGRCYGKCDGILSDDAAQNPLFHSYNKVWIPISGTSFTGDVWNKTSAGYVRGKRIQEAVVQDLLDNYGMKGATNVILTGGSSGGLATYLTCDRVGEQVKTANASTRYTCLADAGYFLHHDAINGANGTSESFKRSYYGWNSTGGTNQACVEDKAKTGEDWKCIFAEYVAPYIKSELYVMQNLYDSWQINNILHIGCSTYNKPMTSCNAVQMAALEQYGSDMRAALGPLTSNPNVGMFTPSCIAHCQSVENEHPMALWYWPDRWSIVEPASNATFYPMTAFNAWYSGSAKGAGTKHVQQCAWSPETCNKLCPLWT